MAISLTSMSKRTGGGRRGKRLHRFSGDDGPRCAKRRFKVMWLQLLLGPAGTSGELRHGPRKSLSILLIRTS